MLIQFYFLGTRNSESRTEWQELGVGIQAEAPLSFPPLPQRKLNLARSDEENMDMKRRMYQELRNRTQAPVPELGLNNSNKMMEN